MLLINNNYRYGMLLYRQLSNWRLAQTRVGANCYTPKVCPFPQKVKFISVADLSVRFSHYGIIFYYYHCVFQAHRITDIPNNMTKAGTFSTCFCFFGRFLTHSAKNTKCIQNIYRCQLVLELLSILMTVIVSAYGQFVSSAIHTQPPTSFYGVGSTIIQVKSLQTLNKPLSMTLH